MLMKNKHIADSSDYSSHMENPFIQTKHDLELGNIALVYVSRVLSAAKFDLFVTCTTIQNSTHDNWTSHCRIEPSS